MNTDLFDNEINDDEYFFNKKESNYQKFKRVNHYRKSDSKTKCKTCFHNEKFNYHNKNYYKCTLIGFSNSSATDVKVNNICDKFEPHK